MAKAGVQGPVQWAEPALPMTTGWTQPLQSVSSYTATAEEIALIFHFFCSLPVLSTVLGTEKGKLTKEHQADGRT